MCGIAAYLGKRNAKDILLACLERMEYRGYDSCGIALVKENTSEILCIKDKGRISELKSRARKISINARCGIAHTRWATHGAPLKKNAHPHRDTAGTVFVVHNGIIENFETLRNKLEKEGDVFHTDTDTEVIPHLISKYYKTKFLSAVLKTARCLKGSFSFCAISSFEPDKVIGVRFFSPLVLGQSSEELFLASDITAFLPWTRRVVYLQDGEAAVLEKNTFYLLDFKGKIKRRAPVVVNISFEQAQKKRYKHFMLKEIFEQPGVMKDIYASYVKKNSITFPHLHLSQAFLKKLQRIHIVGCGTAFHAGLVGKYLFEKWAGLQCVSEVSSEFRYKNINIKADEELFLTISQSGETADTLASLKLANELGVPTVGICNVPGSSLTREVGNVIYTKAGPEIGVASTKAYTAQIMVLALFALYLARAREKLSSKAVSGYLKEMEKMGGFQEGLLREHRRVEKIAGHFSRFGNFLFLGRNINYPSALEGALKLKEISYIPAEGYPAGEMKHGPIALIDEYRGVVCINPATQLYDKMYSNMQEIKARKGRIIGVLTEGDEISSHLCDEVVSIPLVREELTPLLVIIPLQLFAYYVADKLGYDVDKPRNLAKSVTVE